MLRLDFSVSDLNLPATRDKTRRASISGVQDKVQLRKIRGGFDIVDSGGDYILKPVPRNTFAELAADIPANEALTMDIASKVFGIKTAEHELVEMKDGELAYLTRRFDRRDGRPILQEDFCQLSGRTSETHGENYKSRVGADFANFPVTAEVNPIGPGTVVVGVGAGSFV